MRAPTRRYAPCCVNRCAERIKTRGQVDERILMVDWRMRYALALCIALAGCAGMTENQCRVADWAQLGERDGIFGNQPRIEVYAYQCGRYQVAAAEKNYLDGWWVGHAEFVRRADSMEGTQ